jgi:hypothetical protein
MYLIRVEEQEGKNGVERLSQVSTASQPINGALRLRLITAILPAFVATITTAPLTILGSDPRATPPPEEIMAPDRQSAVKIEHRALPGSDPVDEFFTLVLQVHGRTVQESPTMGYLLDAIWNPNNRYVAVNNRRSSAGDYLWIFSLMDGKVLESPNDSLGEALARRAAVKFPELKAAHFDRFTNVAKRWIDSGELEVETRIVFHGPSVLITRHAVYQIAKDKLNLKSEHFEKTPSSKS